MEWYEIIEPEKVLSPALVFYPDRIRHNIDKMIEIAGSADRLRSHIKTIKMPQIVEMQLEKGIKKFKCATLVEARMLAELGVEDILIAMPLVGPNQLEFIKLSKEFSNLRFSTLIDDPDQIELWKKADSEDSIALFVDLNVGMNRTGILPHEALPLIEKIKANDRFIFKGLHIYDGHIRTNDFEERKAECDEGFKKANELSMKLNDPEIEIVCGGSVTFTIHAKYPERTLSPGTTLLWDYNYASNFPDIPMQNAAVVLSRIISKPGSDRICLDLGHKSIASEMSGMRVYFPQLGSYERVGHSEEHLVLQVKNRDQWEIGTLLYGIPWHICPTVALHQEALIVENNKVTDSWKVAARHRQYIPS